MSALKNKAVSPKRFSRAKYKKSIDRHTSVITGGKSGKVFGKLANDIDKLTANLGKQLKGKLSKINPKKGYQVLDFRVIFDGREFRINTPKISGAGAEAEFDPHDVGRKLVLQMQEAEGGAWTGAELGKRFGLTPANLHKRRSEYRIVSWKDAKNHFHYPGWQFNHAGVVIPGVQEVLQTFRSSDEWRVMRYFLAPRHQLDDRAPLDLLRAGEVDKVLAHAKAHGEENSW